MRPTSGRSNRRLRRTSPLHVLQRWHSRRAAAVKLRGSPTAQRWKSRTRRTRDSLPDASYNNTGGELNRQTVWAYTLFGSLLCCSCCCCSRGSPSAQRQRRSFTQARMDRTERSALPPQRSSVPPSRLVASPPSFSFNAPRG